MGDGGRRCPAGRRAVCPPLSRGSTQRDGPDSKRSKDRRGLQLAHGLGAPPVRQGQAAPSTTARILGPALQKNFCKERASVKTRPGKLEDAARARAVTPASPPFTARARSGDLAAGRHRQARVPADRSAPADDNARVIGRPERSGGREPPGRSPARGMRRWPSSRIVTLHSA